MAKKGEILENLKTGDAYEFLETNKSSQGKWTTIKISLKSKGELVMGLVQELVI